MFLSNLLYRHSTTLTIDTLMEMLLTYQANNSTLKPTDNYQYFSNYCFRIASNPAILCGQSLLVSFTSTERTIRFWSKGSYKNIRVGCCETGWQRTSADPSPPPPCKPCMYGWLPHCHFKWSWKPADTSAMFSFQLYKCGSNWLQLDCKYLTKALQKMQKTNEARGSGEKVAAGGGGRLRKIN